MSLPGRRPSFLLELDLDVPLVDPPPQAPLAKALGRGQPALRTVLADLHRAAKDPRVAGLIVRTGGTSHPLAHAQELRDALTEFGASGRPTVAWAETFGEFGRGTSGYLIATGCSEIWLQPTGEVGVTGMAAEALFLRELFDRLGLRAEVGARREYKNAPNLVTERGYTEPHREAMTRLVTSSLGTVLEELAERRGLDADDLRTLVDRAPIAAEDALAAGLVDHLGYRDEAYAALTARLPGAQLRFLHRLTETPAARLRTATARDRRHVAVVDVVGTIRSGRSGRNLFGAAAGADTVNAALRAAARDEHVGAVVLRVDSPGGSYIASDAIWRTSQGLRAAGKPLVVSMGAVAASGGYYVAIGADRILAQPTTVTGSIGVFGGKLVVGDVLTRHGIDHDAVAVGARARMSSPRVGFDADQLAALEAWLDRVYADFKAKVAAARGLSAEEIEVAARGRVWTGADARERGLVDAFGGLPEAVAQARALAGLSPDAPARPLPVPSPLNRFARPRSSEDPRAAAALGPVSFATSVAAAGWGSWAELATALGLPAAGPLTLDVGALRG
ncbi:signal peptide peptidase SppA [Sporichthya brevicatena]|uniref:Signal peptide peptidase SppA n=1 Tax=Sporichthya brevicatena TaxID=171442 RepID=A0ABN1H735_9ACTN